MADPRFTPQAVAEYLRKVHRAADVAGVQITALGGGRQGDKGYGYGIPLRVDYAVGGVPRRGVIESVRPGPFGHEHMADRAQQLLWAHDAFGRLPRHVRSVDVGAVRANGELVPLGNAEELFMLAEFVEGREYADDLIRLRAGEPLRPIDRERGDALCDYLVDLHRMKHVEDGLYIRRLRELVGHGECIFGVADSYPVGGPVAFEALRDIETRCVAWRWRLRGKERRLCRVHGDFHPWNILFREGVDFSVLDRSRGEWGEAADDVSCLAMNYLFFSLQRSGRLEGALRELWLAFWDRYLSRTADEELLAVAAPFLAFRGLVMANPLWYPNLAAGLRTTLLRFIRNVLDAERFDPVHVDDYLK
ncbi:MAG TPA: phosphotransferase [Casimicrobiaceae bacterium]|nr:phosphotransferase [Casimicrobiaceae bacterium]